MKEELKDVLTSNASVTFILMLLRAYVERTENTLDDKIVDAVEVALSVYK